jgi:hypothetical protein
MMMNTIVVVIMMIKIIIMMINIRIVMSISVTEWPESLRCVAGLILSSLRDCNDWIFVDVHFLYVNKKLIKIRHPLPFPFFSMFHGEPRIS